MSLIDHPASPPPVPTAGTAADSPAPQPADAQLRIDGEQADRLLRSSRWQQ